MQPVEYPVRMAEVSAQGIAENTSLRAPSLRVRPPQSPPRATTNGLQ